MSYDKLERKSVLVLNRSWQAIDTKNPRQALLQMAANANTGLDIVRDGAGEIIGMTPTAWDDWVKLPVREYDEFIFAPAGLDPDGNRVTRKVRIPTVVILSKFALVPRKRPRFSASNIRKRDGNMCQYTGRVLGPGEGNLDHIIPVSRGGATDWTNIVWADKHVNSKKGNKTPEEAGLRLLKKPARPGEVLSSDTLHNEFGITDWNTFLKRHG